VFALELLSTFILVAERRSFSAAAGELGIANGVISKRITQLETQLGQPLLRRTTRQVDLTPAGEIYLEVARKVMLDLAEGSEALSSLRREPAGLIRMTAPTAWGARVLGEHLPQFLKLHPKMEIELLLLDRTMDLAHERIDIALRMTDSLAPDEVAIPLAGLERILCASKAYLKANGVPLAPADLEQHACLSYWNESGAESLRLSRNGKSVVTKIHGRYRVNNPDATKQAVLAGLGIGLLPDYVCEEELASRKLVRVLPDWNVQTRFGTKIFAVGLPERIRLPRCQAMLAFLKSTLGGKPANQSARR
jgi:DNA-binding transcriptional LysR family regulator